MQIFLDDTLRQTPRPPYLALMLIEIQQSIAYPIGVLIDTLTSLLSVATVYYLWRAIFSAQPAIEGFNWPTMQAYVLVSNAIFGLLGATSMRPMMATIRTGAITTDLLRPYSYLGAQFAQVLGRTVTQGVVSSAITAGIGITLVHMALPPSLGAAGAFLLSVSFSFLISFLINFLLATLCFWTQDSEGLLWAHGIISYVFSGGMAPLAFMPGWIQSIALILPFGGLIYTPLQIYRGALPHGEIWTLLGLQVVWISILAVLVRVLWRRGLQAAELHGG